MKKLLKIWLVLYLVWTLIVIISSALEVSQNPTGGIIWLVYNLTAFWLVKDKIKNGSD